MNHYKGQRLQKSRRNHTLGNFCTQIGNWTKMKNEIQTHTYNITEIVSQCNGINTNENK